MNNDAAIELNELAALVGRLQLGGLTRSEFRSHSVHYGVYTQRQPDRCFVRLRVPHGAISPGQLTRLATAMENCGRTECHLTTRQGIEVHELSPDQVMPFLRALAEVDLLSHETGGNSIRGIMVCPHAGVGQGEPFDLTPYAAWLTRCFVRHPDFQNLPRKMKIGFSSCAEDCAHTCVQDLGFQARMNEWGDSGFRVVVGGGTGALPRLGQELVEFLPSTQAASFTEAFLRVINRLGDRENRRRARVKFLVERLGLARLKQEVQREWENLERQAGSYPAFEPLAETPPGMSPDDTEPAPNAGCQRADDPSYASWLVLQTQPQQQRAFRTVRVSLPGGQITSSGLQHLAAVAEGLQVTIRTTPDQGLLLRWVRTEHLAAIYQGLVEARLLNRLEVSRLVVCPGSAACSNAFTHAPALAQALTARLAAMPGHDGALGRLRIRVSGCPNGCGLHAVADLGLAGVAHRLEDQWLPAYRVSMGGRESEQRPRLANDLGLVPAHRAPECVARLLGCYLDRRSPGESLADVVERVGIGSFASIVEEHRIERVQDRRALGMDWGEIGAYRPHTAAAPGIC